MDNIKNSLIGAILAVLVVMAVFILMGTQSLTKIENKVNLTEDYKENTELKLEALRGRISNIELFIQNAIDQANKQSDETEE